MNAPRRPGVTWLEIGGGGLAWFVHLLAVYVIGEFACTSRFWTHAIAGAMGISWLLLIVTAVTLLLAGYSIRASWRSWAASRQPSLTQSGGDAASEAAHPVAYVALITNIVFAVIIAVQSIPIFFFLKDCGTWTH